jgi:IS5 family transposase
MIGKTEENPQLNVSRIPLVNGINMKHELVELAQRINWKLIKKDFAPYYTAMGRPAVPVRKMVGCMLLKQMFGLSNEAFVDRWIENPYKQ